MSDKNHRTDTLNPGMAVQGKKQNQHWVEFQLVDEQNVPLPHLPYRAQNTATRDGAAPEYRGQADAQGVIRIEGLRPIPLTLLIDADQLAEVLQTRRLRALRPEPLRPGVGDKTPLYCPPCTGHSPVEAQALREGYGYHYLRIGQLCDKQPSFDPPLEENEALPPYHFPDKDFKGFTLGADAPNGIATPLLNRRHVLEVCPFRAWSLVLNHQREYCLVTAYNLGLMSILSYSKYEGLQPGSVKEFFKMQCQDLSRTPRVLDGASNPPCVVVDVPFNNRYSISEPLDTTKGKLPEGDTQLFYAISNDQVLVGWRGTEMGIPDLATDVTFRPSRPEVQATCEPKVPCADLTSAGSVHLGFRNGFEVARRIFSKELGKAFSDRLIGKDFFICGHSLGGALGLIHAASHKESNPLLYTYGMPRTFTLKAVSCLDEVRHFRHVNDTDLIPDVPPEAAMDNWLYDLYGPLGTTLGTIWSVGQLAASKVVKLGDPFCHHGEIVAFYKAEQHTQDRSSDNPFYQSRKGLEAPYHTVVTKILPAKAKLFLVPSLSEGDSDEARAAQERFKASLGEASLTRYFPRRGNAKSGTLVGVLNHFMTEYQPFLYGQLIESNNSNRMQERQERRRLFEEQMAKHGERIPPAEMTRDRVFLDLQNLVGQTLEATRHLEGGKDALQRFDSVVEESAYVEKVHG
ncbi:lipase family protein [Pseudomonas sp. PDM18]|uniref:lipase family protein n=1 Tax=Pseudomonas sp. PDM18 TaxID=2769253 RepID=UPI001780B064|nr:lipase family protein [Pseudomonas sp. PDM18]MBD9677929.1 lipase family protein [Pseudomonas sp. PDM18]